jgi:hypothetical protein
MPPCWPILLAHPTHGGIVSLTSAQLSKPRPLAPLAPRSRSRLAHHTAAVPVLHI